MNINRTWLPWVLLGLGVFLMGFMLGARVPTPRSFALGTGGPPWVAGDAAPRFHWHDSAEREFPERGVPVPQERRFFHGHGRSGPACGFPLGTILPGAALIALGVWLLRRRNDDPGTQDPPSPDSI